MATDPRQGSSRVSLAVRMLSRPLKITYMILKEHIHGMEDCIFDPRIETEHLEDDDTRANLASKAHRHLRSATPSAGCPCAEEGQVNTRAREVRVTWFKYLFCPKALVDDSKQIREDNARKCAWNDCVRRFEFWRALVTLIYHGSTFLFENKETRKDGDMYRGPTLGLPVHPVKGSTTTAACPPAQARVQIASTDRYSQIGEPSYGYGSILAPPGKSYLQRVNDAIYKIAH